MTSWGETQTQEKILDLLREMGNATISDISRESKINRITVSKYLAVMEARGVISFKQVGNAKLYYHKYHKSGSPKNVQLNVR